MKETKEHQTPKDGEVLAARDPRGDIFFSRASSTYLQWNRDTRFNIFHISFAHFSNKSQYFWSCNIAEVDNLDRHKQFISGHTLLFV